MSPFQLWLLILLSIVGAWLSARVEAAEINRRILSGGRKELPHLLYMVIRLGSGLLLVRLVANPENFWLYAICMLMMMGSFAPSHRILLNTIRRSRYPKTNHGITWDHLGKTSWYDRFYMQTLRMSMRTAFLVMSGFELLVAAAAYSQLQNQ